ncbi:hypothetical protein CLV59_106118 [Chitinophaga dinghuensis]|uniref:Uncharacterized protein n=1 Tax=Chitinophaga dinghuensis TaxID=1539050 RepID=A0A327W2A1_9BACT|nr:hypothetical protein CLV59_106118 [Chitinophaga dinghuensis]
MQKSVLLGDSRDFRKFEAVGQPIETYLVLLRGNV